MSVEQRQHELLREESGTGLVVYRASRLEALIGPLWSLLDVSWSENVLEPQTIVVAHPAMKQWIAGAIARHLGTSGILANLDVVLPSLWLDRLAMATLGERAVSLPRYQRARMCWTLHEMLSGPPVAGVSDPRIAAYLAASDPSDTTRAGELARRRYQLSDRLARIYSQYLVYRPDWLHAWERGQFRYAAGASATSRLAALETQLLGPLWKQLVTVLGRHRGQVTEELRASLMADGNRHPTLHLFGVSHMAPTQIDIVRTYAARGLVAVYVPDPCREFWGGLVRWNWTQQGPAQPWKSYHAEESARIAEAGEGDYWQAQGHPLLARWGRMGQHFLGGLADGEVREDIRHWQDEHPAPPVNRLQRLQESIRQLNPDLMRFDAMGTPLSRLGDASLRVHACHTRLRELEVLHDVFLDALAQGIQPGEMIVMAPDIQAYLPLIPTVFGAAGDLRERLPFHLADAPISSSHRLFTTFQRLLDLPGQRITAPDVVDLLSVPEVQRRFGIDEDAVEDLTAWLEHSRVAWALDTTHRARFGVPPIAEHTFAWALDRMIAGYLLGDAPSTGRDVSFELPDGTELAPVRGIEGPAAHALGALDRLLGQLQELQELAHESHTASHWASALDAQLDALFRIDVRDRLSRDAWATLKRLVAAVQIEPEEARVDPVLHFDVVRDLLVDALAAVPEQQLFLMGGITFCGMVAQRAIPFRVVAVLGLNDGTFPRNASDAGLDLMTRIRRMGDRDVRSDDRYLFLETIMSARDRLHLSYVGQGVKDGKPRNPAAPLAELMAELDRTETGEGDTLTQRRAWWIAHPLQPFDARYFDDTDPRLFSYDQRYQAMHRTGENSRKRFLGQSSGDPDPLPHPLAVAEVASYYKDPAKNVLARRLKLRLDALDAQVLPEDEPLAEALDAIATVARRVFFEEVLPAWPEGLWQPQCIPSWVRLTGLLPPGRLGEEAWKKELSAIQAAMEAARCCGTLQDVATQARTLALDVELGEVLGGTGPSVRMTGQVANVFPLLAEGPAALQLVRVFPSKGSLKTEDDLHFGERVPIFLDWALTRLQTARSSRAPGAVRVTLLVTGALTPWQAGLNAWDTSFVGSDENTRQTLLGDLQARVLRLVDWWHQAQRLPHTYFARTSWKAAQAVETQEVGAIDKAWSSGATPKESDYGLGYNRLLGGGIHFDAPSPERDELMDFARTLHETISFPVPKPVP